MKILLRYFKRTGKWYTDEYFNAKSEEWNAAMDELKEYMRTSNRSLDTEMVCLAMPISKDFDPIGEEESYGVPKLFNI